MFKERSAQNIKTISIIKNSFLWPLISQQNVKDLSLLISISVDGSKAKNIQKLL